MTPSPCQCPGALTVTLVANRTGTGHRLPHEPIDHNNIGWMRASHLRFQPPLVSPDSSPTLLIASTADYADDDRPDDATAYVSLVFIGIVLFILVVGCLIRMCRPPRRYCHGTHQHMPRRSCPSEYTTPPRRPASPSPHDTCSLGHARTQRSYAILTSPAPHYAPQTTRHHDE